MAPVRRASIPPLLALAVAAALLIGCGDGDTSAEEAQEQFGVNLGVPIQLANCTDWNRGSVDERLGTIRQIREFAGGPVGSPAGTGATLEDEEAYELFENYCDQEFARGFKLYKLYTRAAAFGGPQ
jgi:hypothetical protein